MLDLKMPGMSGIEMLREIRADDRIRGLPCGSHVPQQLESDNGSNAAEPADYIQKPLELAKFSEDLDLFCVACCELVFGVFLQIPLR